MRLPRLAAALVIMVVVSSPVPLGTASAGLPPPLDAPAAAFSWPLAPPHPVLRRFQAPATKWGPGHRGVDLGGAPGDPVFAVADGTVVFAAHLVDRGVVSVDHAGGLRSTYEPLTPTVAAGTTVRRGDVLGHLLPGHPGCAAAACLHWGLRRGDDYLDPLVPVSARRPVRLLPWRTGSRGSVDGRVGLRAGDGGAGSVGKVAAPDVAKGPFLSLSVLQGPFMALALHGRTQSTVDGRVAL